MFAAAVPLLVQQRLFSHRFLLPVLPCLSCPADLLQLLRGLVSSSPKVTTQQLDWGGKPTGFTLAPTAAPACKVKFTTSHPTAAAAAADALGTLAGKAAAAAQTSVLFQGLAFNAAWAAPGVSETYSAWLRAWGLAQPGKTLEAALLLLLAVCQVGGWGAAGVLYGGDVSSFLEQLCTFVDLGAQAILQRLYR
jgi:hypothetical protein